MRATAQSFEMPVRRQSVINTFRGILVPSLMESTAARIETATRALA
jgi:hypothetical protein